MGKIYKHEGYYYTETAVKRRGCNGCCFRLGTLCTCPKTIRSNCMIKRFDGNRVFKPPHLRHTYREIDPLHVELLKVEEITDENT